MKPIVSFTTEPEFLIESEETIALYNLTLSEPPPDTGITVNINAPNLSEFDLSKAQVEGGQITLDDELEQQLQNALDGTRAAEIPGAAVAIVSPFASWFAASGVSRLEDNTPLKPDDRFEIGSITKTFVATTVLQLVEEGKLSLEDTLTTLLPESITADILNSETITLKQLLQHTSGIPDYVDVLFNQASDDPTVFLQEWEPEELVDLTDGVEPYFEPGESWRYSSTNFILAGLIIEAVTGNNIAAEIRTRILEPLNLENTFFAKEEEIPGGYISGYWDFNEDGTLDNISVANISWTWAAGAMVSNTQDLDTFARSLFKGDLLEPQTLEQMLDTIPTTDPVNYSSYGLGVGTIESPNRFWYIHRGQTLGYRSNMWYSPADDLTYIELINGFSRDNLVRDILPLFREGIADENFNFTITEQNAQISLPVANDGEIEGEEIVTFTLEPGEEYEVDSNAQTGTFTIFDTSDEANIIKPTVSFTSEPKLLIESQETVSLLNFSLSETPPELGTTVTINSSDLSEFNLNSIETQGGEINLSKDIQSQLRAALKEKVTAETPGATIAITSPLGNWSEAAGIANIENNTPVTTKDRFEIGSITKTFTAATILKLVEAGTITLDDTLTDWLPEEVTTNIANSGEISIRQLLNHTSGIAEYDAILLQQALLDPTVFLKNWQPEELVELTKGLQPFFAPGESWQYSNTNYILAGMIISAATGNNIAAEIRSQILEPLNLENTFFAQEEEIPGGYVSGYLDFDLDGNLDDVSIANLSWSWTSGAIVSNTEDLTQFAQALYEGELLSTASRSEMFTLVDTGRGYSYGLGMMSFETPDLGTVVGHRGGSLGFSSNMWYSSSDNFTYVDLVNARTEEELVKDVIPKFTEGLIPQVGNIDASEELNFTITEQNAQISLRVANDGETEGEEIATFTIEEGNRYEINPDAQTTTFTILDTLQSFEELILTPVADDNTTEIIDLRSFGNREITAEYTISREADFDNQVYFYAVDDINGNIDNLAPGADGYLQAALENIVQQQAFETSDDNTESGTIQMEAGSIIAPMIIVDGTLESAKSGEATVYLSYGGSNGNDNFDHIKMLNSNTFSFEDLPNGGDQDFNDIVITFDKLSA